MANVRRNGLAMFASALACGVIMAMATYSFDLLKWRPVLLVVAVPVALALAGLTQCITGVPFLQLSSQWNSLQGWQRGLLGLLFVATFCVILFSCILTLIASGNL